MVAFPSVVKKNIALHKKIEGFSSRLQ